MNATNCVCALGIKN